MKLSPRHAKPAPAGGAGWRWPSLAVALTIVLGGSIYPFALAGRSGGVDHGFVLAVFWAMSAGLVHGVGFTPRQRLWRWLFSGWACWLALLLALLGRWA